MNNIKHFIKNKRNRSNVIMNESGQLVKKSTKYIANKKYIDKV